MTHWTEQAKCTTVSINVFFPEIPSGDIRQHYWLEAKQICATCPVIKECLAFVLPIEKEINRRDGYWAGMTPKERTAYDNATTAGKGNRR